MTKQKGIPPKHKIKLPAEHTLCFTARDCSTNSASVFSSSSEDDSSLLDSSSPLEESSSSYDKTKKNATFKYFKSHTRLKKH
jgi:hypothetical protein